MSELQKSIDGWEGKDIWQSCSEFILGNECQFPLWKTLVFESLYCVFLNKCMQVATVWKIVKNYVRVYMYLSKILKLKQNF